MEIFDLVAEGWTKVSQGLNYTTYSKPFSSLTQKDLDLFKYADEVRAFENNNIPSNFTEEVGDRVYFTYGFGSSNINLTIHKRVSSGINSNKNYTHLVYKKRDVIKNDSEIVLSHRVEMGGKNLSITNLTPAFVWVLNRNNNTFKSITTKIVGNFEERNDLNPSKVTLKPLIPITNTNIYNQAFSDTSFPYTTVNAGTYTFALDLLTPHFVCGFFRGSSTTAYVQLKLYHEVSSDNGTTWTTLQSFSVWNSSSFISSFIFPLIYDISNLITNRRLRIVAVENLSMHYLYVINISQPSGNINI